MEDTLAPPGLIGDGWGCGYMVLYDGYLRVMIDALLKNGNSDEAGGKKRTVSLGKNGGKKHKTIVVGNHMHKNIEM